MENITCGVPQGSLLGPLMFLINVNDLQKASSLLKPTMSADDTTVFYLHMLKTRDDFLVRFLRYEV